MNNKLKPWWGACGPYEYGMILVFARSNRQAKILTFANFPLSDMEYTEVRVRRADDKWMKLYDGQHQIVDHYGGDYETWDEYWNNEIEPTTEESINEP